jgi:DNA-binding CsgD family transcriptional regulator
MLFHKFVDIMTVQWGVAMRKRMSRLALDADERRELRRMARSGDLSRRIVVRACIVLAASEGISNREIGRRLRVSRPTVIEWRARFLAGGLDALLREAPRPGRPRRISMGVVDSIVRATLETVPQPAGRWSVRSMAAAYGLSPSTVRRIWIARGLLPRIVAPVTPVGTQDAP